MLKRSIAVFLCPLHKHHFASAHHKNQLATRGNVGTVTNNSATHSVSLIFRWFGLVFRRGFPFTLYKNQGSNPNHQFKPPIRSSLTHQNRREKDSTPADPKKKRKKSGQRRGGDHQVRSIPMGVLATSQRGLPRFEMHPLLGNGSGRSPPPPPPVSDGISKQSHFDNLSGSTQSSALEETLGRSRVNPPDPVGSSTPSSGPLFWVLARDKETTPPILRFP